MKQIISKISAFVILRFVAVLLLLVLTFSLFGCNYTSGGCNTDGGVEPEEWIPDADLDLNENGTPDINDNESNTNPDNNSEKDSVTNSEADPDASQPDDEDKTGPSANGGAEPNIWFPDPDLSSQKLLCSYEQLIEAVEIIKKSSSLDPYYAFTGDLPDGYTAFYYFSCSEKMDHPVDFEKFFESEGLNKDFYILIYDTGATDHSCTSGNYHRLNLTDEDESREVYDLCKDYPLIAINPDGIVTELTDKNLISIDEIINQDYVYRISYNGSYALSIISCMPLEDDVIYSLLDKLSVNK